MLRSLLSLKPKATRTSRVRFRFIQGSMRVLFNKGCRRFLRAMVLEYWMKSMLCNNTFVVKVVEAIVRLSAEKDDR